MIQVSKGYRTFQFINVLIMMSIVVVCLYPFLYTLSVSLSDVSAVMSHKVSIYPIGFNLQSYKIVVQHPSFATGYFNTVLYTGLGTLIGLVMTTICAYPLSKDHLMGRSLVMKFIVFTMFFGGGLIPNFLVIKSLGLIDKIGAIVLPGAINTYYLIVMITFFKAIPDSIEEAAAIDGLNPIQTLLRIVLPLSKPVMATIGLFFAVAFWNDWFNAMIYLNSSERTPIMLVLRNIVMGAEMAAKQTGGLKNNTNTVLSVSATFKSSAIILSTLPILVMYPFVQKYFVKGVMIGSLKG